MMSQKEQAEKLRQELAQGQPSPTENIFMQKAAKTLKKEREALEKATQEAIGSRGYVISVPNTEVVLYENENFQFLYCNNIDSPGKISFLMAFKTVAHAITGRTPITSQGYVAKIMPKDQMNVLLSMIQGYNNHIKGLQERVRELEKELAPLQYINHLIKEYKVDLEK